MMSESLQQLRQSDVGAARLVEGLVMVRIEAQHLDPETLEEIGKDTADLARPDHAHRLAVQVKAEQAVDGEAFERMRLYA